MNPWFIHYYREFGEWLQEKEIPAYLTICGCGRITTSDPNRLSKEYCKKMGIQFRCGSCLFPQYENTLKTPTRGNIGKVYGYRFSARLNKFVKI